MAAHHNSDHALFLKLLAHYRPELEISWHYNEAHHGKAPMNGIWGTLKNVVYRQVKSDRVTINLVSDFVDAANRFVPSITTLFHKYDETIPEPEEIKEHSFNIEDPQAS